MKNLEEKLTLMQWLSEKGFQPEMWLYGWEHKPLSPFGLYFEKYEMCPNCDEYNAGCLGAWFPLEQVLDLLPWRLSEPGYDDGWSLNVGLNCKSPNIRYEAYWCDNKHITPIDGDLHLAALKLLKQVAEQYPEAVKP